MSTNIDKRVFSLLLLSGLFGISASIAREFFYVNMAKTWLEAQGYCREKYTDLATVDNMHEMMRVIDIVDLSYFGDVWIGLRKGSETRWGWSKGEDTVSEYSVFNTMPDNVLRNGSCTAINQDGYWYSLSCLYTMTFICYNEYNNVIYSLPYEYNWRDAQEYCREEFTDLASIHNEAQQQIVLKLVSGDYMWIGLFSDNWKWSDKATSFFRYWGKGKPLSLFNISNCAVMQMNDKGTWDDSLCDKKLPFVCYKGTTTKKKQVMKVKVRSDGMTDMNDPLVKANILKKIEELLRRNGMMNYTISWRAKDGIVFHPESDDVK